MLKKRKINTKRKTIIKSLIFAAVLTSNVINIVVAEELVVLDSDAKVAEVYLGKWGCDYIYKGAAALSGTYERDYETATLKIITGKGKDSYCSTAWSKIKGKIKGDKTIFKLTEYPAPCKSSTSCAEQVYMDSAGNYLLKGRCRWSAGSSTISCVKSTN